MINLTEVRLDDEAFRLVSEVLRSGQLAQGPMVAELEHQFAKVSGTDYAVATSSGTSALVAAIEALSLRPGDEVITSAFTFVATLNAILEAGATARIVDIGLEDYTIDPDEVAAAITTRTRAIMPVHLFGCPADMAALDTISRRSGVPIIEDAAQAHGAEFDGRRAGSWGVGAFSFYATKNITTGEGGIVTTNDEAIADRIRLLRNQGMRVRYQYEVHGHNYRMTDLQAAVGISQLRHLDEWTEQRRSNARALAALLEPIACITVPKEPVNRRHVFHQFTVLIGDDAPVGRDQLVSALSEAEIGSGIFYPKPVHDYECYLGHPQVKWEAVPNAQRASQRVLSLPVHQWLSAEDIAHIGRALAGILDR